MFSVAPPIRADVKLSLPLVLYKYNDQAGILFAIGSTKYHKLYFRSYNELFHSL